MANVRPGRRRNGYEMMTEVNEIINVIKMMKSVAEGTIIIKNNSFLRFRFF